MCHLSIVSLAAKPVGPPERAFPMARCVRWGCVGIPGTTLTSLTTTAASPQAIETQIPDPPLPPSPTAAGDVGG